MTVNNKKTLFMFCRVSAEAAVAATIAIQNQNVNRNLLLWSLAMQRAVEFDPTDQSIHWTIEIIWLDV